MRPPRLATIPALALVAVMLIPPTATSAACLANWTNTGPVDVSMGVGGLSALSADEAWIVGTQPVSGGSVIRSVRWDGASWQEVAMPQPGSGPELLDVDLLTSDDGWAVGTHHLRRLSMQVPLFMHRDGEGWTRIPAPRLASGVATGVSMVASDDVWASALYTEIDHWEGAVLHWDDEAWAVVPTPDPAGGQPFSAHFYTAIDATVDGYVWVVGASYQPNALVALRWDGLSWTDVSVDRDFSPRGAGFLGVTALEGGGAWAVGHRGNTSEQVAYRWRVDHLGKVGLPDTPEGDGNALFDVEARDGRIVTVGSAFEWDLLIWTREGGVWTVEDVPGTRPRAIHEIDVTPDGAWFAAGVRETGEPFVLQQCSAA